MTKNEIKELTLHLVNHISGLEDVRDIVRAMLAATGSDMAVFIPSEGTKSGVFCASKTDIDDAEVERRLRIFAQSLIVCADNIKAGKLASDGSAYLTDLHTGAMSKVKDEEGPCSDLSFAN